MLYVLLVWSVINVVLSVKILMLVNKIKIYQYTNNLKLVGLIKRENQFKGGRKYEPKR